MNKRGYTHLTRGKHRCGICQPFAYGLEANITSANFGKYLWGNSVLTKATEHAVMPWFSRMLLSHIVAKSHTETRRFSEMYASFGFSGAGPRQPADNTNVCLDGALGRYIDFFLQWQFRLQDRVVGFPVGRQVGIVGCVMRQWFGNRKSFNLRLSNRRPHTKVFLSCCTTARTRAWMNNRPLTNEGSYPTLELMMFSLCSKTFFEVFAPFAFVN